MAISTMYPAKPGSPKTILTAQLAANGTSMTLDDASVLPAAPNICVLGSDENAEIVSYTVINGNTVSGLVRALGGTTASVWPVSTAVARNFTSFDHDRFKANIETLESEKQAALTFDSSPTENSTNPVTSGGVYSALGSKQNTLTFDSTPTSASTNPVTSEGIKTALDLKASLASPALTGTPTAPTAAVGTSTTQIATTAFVTSHEPFTITGTFNQGNSKTFTDSRIDSDHWQVIEITFGTPKYITGSGTWTTNSANHTLTLNITATASTTVTIVMAWFQ